MCEALSRLLFISFSVFCQAALPPPINCRGINLYRSVYLLLCCLSHAYLKYVSVPERVAVKRGQSGTLRVDLCASIAAEVCCFFFLESASIMNKNKILKSCQKTTQRYGANRKRFDYVCWCKISKEFEIALCLQIPLFSKNNSIYFNIFKYNSIGNSSSFDCEPR